MNNEHNITADNYQDDFVMKLAKSGEDILDSLVNPRYTMTINNADLTSVSNKLHLLHMAVGVAGEAFEFGEAVVQSDKENQVEELGDSLFYAVGMFPMLKLEGNWDDYLQGNKSGDTPSFMKAAGELLDQTKKYIVYNKDAAFPDIQEAWKAYMAELTDACIYLAGPHIQAVIDPNVNKLSKRYAGLNYSDKAAHDRADKA